MFCVRRRTETSYFFRKSERERSWHDMSFREVGSNFQKKFTQRKTSSLLLFKRHFGNSSGVGCQQPWGCIAEDWMPVMDTQYRHLPQSLSPHPLPCGSWTDRLTQTHSITKAFDATCSLEACHPAHLLRPLAKVHTQWDIFLDTKEASIWKLISND